MLDVVKVAMKPLRLNQSVLEAAYELYSKAPQASHPVIDLRQLTRMTGKSLLECRNAIVEANRLGRFPDCTLRS